MTLSSLYHLDSGGRSAAPLMGAYFLLYHLGGRVRPEGDRCLSVFLPVDVAETRVIEPDEDWLEALFEDLPWSRPYPEES